MTPVIHMVDDLLEQLDLSPKYAFAGIDDDTARMLSKASRNTDDVIDSSKLVRKMDDGAEGSVLTKPKPDSGDVDVKDKNHEITDKVVHAPDQSPEPRLSTDDFIIGCSLRQFKRLNNHIIVVAFKVKPNQ